MNSAALRSLAESSRYIDIVFVAYGQVSSPEFGIDKGICLKTPRCRECGITEYCRYAEKNP